MGCDGWITDKTKPLKIEVRCYACNRAIKDISDVEELALHKRCRDADGELPVDIEYKNYRGR